METNAVLMSEKKLLTTDEAAERLSLSKRTVWGLLKSGELASVRFGKRAVRVSPAAIDRFIRSREAGGPNGVD